MQTGYTVRLHVTKQFTSGNLSGITLDESLPFCNGDDAARWLDGVAKNHDRGSVDYKVVSHWTEAL